LGLEVGDVAPGGFCAFIHNIIQFHVPETHDLILLIRQHKGAQLTDYLMRGLGSPYRRHG
jgi:hypothetical protein